MYQRTLEQKYLSNSDLRRDHLPSTELKNWEKKLSARLSRFHVTTRYAQCYPKMAHLAVLPVSRFLHKRSSSFLQVLDANITRSDRDYTEGCNALLSYSYVFCVHILWFLYLVMRLDSLFRTCRQPRGKW